MNLEDVHLRGTRAAQPAANTVAEGTIYCVTDEDDILEMRDSTVAWVAYSPTGTGSGDVVGPGSATDNAVSRFDGTTGKLIQNSVVTVGDTGAFTFPDNIRQTFNPGANNAGLNVGAHTADPSTPSNGDIYYDSVNNLLRARINGAWSNLGASSGGDVVGPGSATDEALTRFDSTTGKLVQNSNITLSDTGVLTFPDNVRQTFNPGANNSGFNVGSHTADPSTPSNGDIYYDSTNNLLRARINGAWVSLGASSSAVRRQIVIVIDGGGSVITTGVKGYLSLPLAGTWKKWRILSIDNSVTSGSIVIDIWKDTYANYPPALADTITASDKPTVSSATKAEGSSLTGWTTSFSSGDCIGINVDSVTSFTKVSITLEYE